MDDDRQFETLAVGHGEDPTETQRCDVVSPIHLAPTFAVPELDTEPSLEAVDPDEGQFVSSRLNNPTRHALERRLAALEGGDHGFAFGSGTAAIATAVFAATEPGDHVVAGRDRGFAAMRVEPATN